MMMITIMSHARIAGYIAVVSSIAALVACLVYVPLLLLKINEINVQLRSDTEQFRVIADEAWVQLLDARTMAPGGGAKRSRTVRQSPDEYGSSRSNQYNNGAAVHERPMQKVYPLPDYSDGKKDEFVEKSPCACNAANQCPPGLPGQPGMPGEDGKPGTPGKPGPPGLEGIAPPVTIDQNARCRVCPNGPRGPPGPAGKDGLAGLEGGPGPPGRDGLDGRPGYDGTPGIPGTPGKSGKAGSAGPPGKNGVRGTKGAPGPKGEPGSPGPPGPDGYPGPDGHRGTDGPIGETGTQGPPGEQGEDGQPGNPGINGEPGEDGEYCTCPARSAGVEKGGSYDNGVKSPPPIRVDKPAYAKAPQSSYDAAVHKPAPYETRPSVGIEKQSPAHYEVEEESVMAVDKPSSVFDNARAPIRNGQRPTPSPADYDENIHPPAHSPPYDAAVERAPSGGGAPYRRRQFRDNRHAGKN